MLFAGWVLTAPALAQQEPPGGNQGVAKSGNPAGFMTVRPDDKVAGERKFNPADHPIAQAPVSADPKLSARKWVDALSGNVPAPVTVKWVPDHPDERRIEMRILPNSQPDS